MERVYFARFSARHSSTAVTSPPACPAPPAQPVTMEGDPPNPPAQPVPPPLVRPEDVAPPLHLRPLELAQPAPQAVQPPTKRAPSALASTSLDLDLALLEAGGKMPFVPPEELTPAQRAPRTRRSPVYRPPGLGETAPLGDDSMIRALAALPFPSDPAGAAFRLGGLTLEQYASFCAELAVSPAEEAQLLEKYHVTTRAALDHPWQQHFAQHPERRDAFESNLAEYTRYVRSLDAGAKPRRA